MDRYSATMQENAVTAANTTAGYVRAPGTTRRARMYEFSLSHSGAPEEKTVYWTVQRGTTAGTVGSAVTAALLDLGSPAAAFLAGENYSVEPTFTAATELWQHGLNQRNTWRWVASPYGEFVMPAIADNGIGFRVLSTNYTGVAEATAMWVE